MNRTEHGTRRTLTAAVAVAVLVAMAGGGVVAATKGVSGTETTARTGAAEVVVDLNTATAEELTAVPGIGPSLSKRIVEFREQNGPFRRVEDVMKVRGIGEKSFQKIKPYLKVGKKS
jgi:competence protein ComEA